MRRTIMVLFGAVSVALSGGLVSTPAYAEAPKKVYTYEQKNLGKAIKKDLRIKAAVFVSENNLKVKDSLFNPPEELVEKATVSIEKINADQKQAQKRTDAQLVAGLLVSALRESGKFSIVERQDINAILREAEFSNSKWVSPEQANKIGVIYGVPYIVIANLLKSEAGEKVAANSYAVALRLCEVETGNISATGVGDGPNIKDAVMNAVRHFTSQMASEPWSTRIVKVEGDVVYLAAGSDEGLKKKNVLEVYAIKGNIVDPLTNKVLGVEKEKVGEVEITEISGPALSKAKVSSSSRPITSDCIVQALPVAAPGTAERAQWRRIFGASSSEKPSAESPEKSAVVPAETSNTSMSVEALVQQATPAVVMIVGMSKPLGSGFLVSPDGTIVTNYHVIKGSEGLGVRFSQDKEVITNISVVKTDPVRDIAIIKVNVPINAAPLPLGDSDQLSAGERVVAIGNPFGLQNTVSDGLVSAVRDFQGVKQIQFSAPISPGSSGGALLNMRGEVVGITSSHVTGEAQNLCFAVPINYVKEDLQ